MIVDCHVHAGPWVHKPLRGEDYSVFNYWDRFGSDIDKAIFFPSDHKDNVDVYNQVLLSDKGSFMAWWCDPYSKTNIPLNKRIVALKIHAGIDRAENGIYNNLYESYLIDAKRRVIPVIVHCGGWELTSSYKHLIDTARLFSEIKFVAAHCGGKDDLTQYNALHKLEPYENIWVDIGAVKYPHIIRHAVDIMGVKRVLFGSDWPIMPPTASIEVVKHSGLSKSECKKLFSNGVEFFNV